MTNKINQLIFSLSIIIAYATNAASIDVLSLQQESAVSDNQNRQQHHSLRSRGLISNDLLQHHDTDNVSRELQQVKNKFPKTVSGECMVGSSSCKLDTDCENGLSCSATNTTYLKQHGLHTIKAYCDTNVGNVTQNVCYRKSFVESTKRCHRNVAPKPLDACPSDTMKRACSVGPAVCCRTLKRIDKATGRKICNPQTCSYSRSCSCTATTSWACKFVDLPKCETNCFN